MTAAEPNSDPLLLEAEQVKRGYTSGHRRIEVLCGLDLSLKSGQSMSIRGESGCGKSTLLNILAGIETVEAGKVLWHGTDLQAIPVSQRPLQRGRFMGFVFQSFYLIPELTCLENVLFAARVCGQPAKVAKERGRELLDRLGLGERLGSRPEQLSGGERQRTAIARALINNPAVVLADEPTGNLDEASAGRVMDQLLEVVAERRCSLVLVTHNQAFAGRTDVGYRLEGGVLKPSWAGSDIPA